MEPQYQSKYINPYVEKIEWSVDYKGPDLNYIFMRIELHKKRGSLLEYEVSESE